jgi:hypothetical protein
MGSVPGVLDPQARAAHREARCRRAVALAALAARYVVAARLLDARADGQQVLRARSAVGRAQCEAPGLLAESDAALERREPLARPATAGAYLEQLLVRHLIPWRRRPLPSVDAVQLAELADALAR